MGLYLGAAVEAWPEDCPLLSSPAPFNVVRVAALDVVLLASEALGDSLLEAVVFVEDFLLLIVLFPGTGGGDAAAEDVCTLCGVLSRVVEGLLILLIVPIKSGACLSPLCLQPAPLQDQSVIQIYYQ
eukprot:gb/GECG01014465.1/.p1 GENE.gb/GECG01014465.1/~~gb/GECG01014465.1/.p1  ORF type:complete len:127 (+),score=14.05 gb/GECG01014465.1/:1-381(+)